MTTTSGECSRRRVVGLSGAVVLGGLAGCVSGGNTPPGTDDGGGGDGLVTYTHGAYGYSLRLPSAWTVREDVVIDGTSFATVVEIPGEDGDVGRLYVADVPDAHPRNDVVEQFVAASADHWDAVETGEVEIADGQSLPVATVSAAGYLQVRWLSVLAGATRFDVVLAAGVEALTPGLAAALDATLRSFAPPEGPPAGQRMASAPIVAASLAAPGMRAVPVRNPGSETGADGDVGILAGRRGAASAALDPCAAHEQRLRELNAEANRLDGEQAALERGVDSALEGLLGGFEETSGEGLPGLNRAFELIVVLCNLVGAFVSAHAVLRDEQDTVRDRRAQAARDRQQCRLDNPDSAPDRASGTVTAVTRTSITLDLENVPMDRFSLRFVTEDGDGTGRVEDIGPIDAPGGRFSGTVDFGAHGVSTANRKVRSIAVLVPTGTSGSDRPVTQLTSVHDPYGDVAD